MAEAASATDGAAEGGVVVRKDAHDGGRRSVSSRLVYPVGSKEPCALTNAAVVTRPSRSSTGAGGMKAQWSLAWEA